MFQLSESLCDIAESCVADLYSIVETACPLARLDPKQVRLQRFRQFHMSSSDCSIWPPLVQGRARNRTRGMNEGAADGIDGAAEPGRTQVCDGPAGSADGGVSTGCIHEEEFEGLADEVPQETGSDSEIDYALDLIYSGRGGHGEPEDAEPEPGVSSSSAASGFSCAKGV